MLSVRRYSLIAAALALALAGCYHGSKPPSIGIYAPDFTIQDSDHAVSLNQLRGKVVVLNFWATWCPPCAEEMPSLVQLQKKVQDKGVTVLAVSVDDAEADYHKFLKDYGVDFLTVRESGKRTDAVVISPTANKYGTFKIPESYVIDRKGVIRRRFIGAVNWMQPEIVEYLSRLQ